MTALRWNVDDLTGSMTPTEASHALALAQVRGYLVLEEAPTDPPSSPEVRWIHDQWYAHCEALSVHPIVVCPGLRAPWCVMIAFPDGPDAVLADVRHAFAEAFRRHLGRDPSRGDPDAWAARMDDRAVAEGIAAELAAIDARSKKPTSTTRADGDAR